MNLGQGVMGTGLLAALAIWLGGPCLGGAATKIIPLDANWEEPVGVSQTVCAAGSGAISDIYANIFKGQSQGRLAGTIPITGRGVGLPEGDRRTQNDLKRDNNPTVYNGPYNRTLSPSDQYRMENPGAPEGATENNKDGGFNMPFFRNTNNYTYNGAISNPNWQYVEQPVSAGSQDLNNDGVISLGEATNE